MPVRLTTILKGRPPERVASCGVGPGIMLVGKSALPTETMPSRNAPCSSSVSVVPSRPDPFDTLRAGLEFWMQGFWNSEAGGTTAPPGIGGLGGAGRVMILSAFYLNRVHN